MPRPGRGGGREKKVIIRCDPCPGLERSRKIMGISSSQPGRTTGTRPEEGPWSDETARTPTMDQNMTDTSLPKHVHLNHDA